VAGLVAVAGEAVHPGDVALDEGPGDPPLPLGAVATLDLGRDDEADDAALDVPRERRVVGLVEVVDAEEGHVVRARHHAEVLRVHVAQAQDGRHPGVLPRHVAVEEQGRAPEEGVHGPGELVELRPGVVAAVGDARAVVLSQGLAHVDAAVVAGEVARQGDHLAAGPGRREIGERVVARGAPAVAERAVAGGPGLPLARRGGRGGPGGGGRGGALGARRHGAHVYRTDGAAQGLSRGRDARRRGPGSAASAAAPRAATRTRRRWGSPRTPGWCDPMRPRAPRAAR
jgi:hypothetical protein